MAGRIKDLIIIRGRNVYPQDVELTIEQAHPALRRGCGAAFAVEAQGEERLVVVQELERRQRHADIDAVAEAIRCAVAEEHELQVYGVALIKPASIPRTSSGKIQRRATRAAFLAGRLDLIGASFLEGAPLTADGLPDRDTALELTRAALLAGPPGERQLRLLAFLRAHAARLLGLRPDQIEPGRPVPAFGLDSLPATELCARIEQNLGVVVPVERVLGGESLDSLARFVHDCCVEVAEAPVAPVARGSGLEEAGGLPLSFAQERMWYLDRLEPGSPAYTIPALLRLSGPLDVDELRHSLNGLVRRHDSLHTAFHMTGERLVQAVHPDLPPPLNVLDLRAYSDDEQAVQVERALQAEVARPFALDAGPLFRATLLCLRDEAHLLFLVLHHIIADGWSLGVLARDLAALYDAHRAGVPADLAPLPVQYADFALWQRQALRDEVIDQQVQYWTRKLAGAPPALALPADVPGTTGATGRAGRHRSVLPAALVEQVASFSRERGVTPFVTLLAALKLTLFRWTGQGDLVIGSVVAGRQHAVTLPLVGCFINFLPLRSRLADDMTAATLLDQVRTTVLEAHAHQDAPFERVVLTRHTSGLAGLMAAERHGLPLVTLALAPYQFAALTLAEDVYRHVLGAGINALRAGVGLAPIRHWRAWLNSAPCHVALWPDWFAAADETWPAGTVPAGFAPGDEDGELPEALLCGLNHDPAPVLITGGTGSLVARAFYEVAAEACRRLGRRTILVTRYADRLPAGLPGTIEWYSALPFARLMPAIGAVIHHGGIGTAGRALLSGTPQLVLPDTGDRPDNAARLAQLGVAEVLMPREWQPDRVAAALARLLEAPAVRARCDELRQWATRDDPALAVCRAAEAALAEGPRAGTEPAGEPTVRDDLRERLRNLSPAQQALLAERLKHRR